MTTKFIRIDCLIVNALIEINSKNILYITYEQLISYALAVITQYKRIDNGNDALLIGNISDMQRLAIDYYDSFEIVEDEKSKYIFLKETINVTELKERFRWVLSYEMLKAINRVNILDIIKD